MPLISQAAFARLVGVSRQAIAYQVRNGLIPTHGAGKRIDPAEAQQWYWPKIDAGSPQLRAARGDPDPGLAERVSWWRWCDTTAQTLARSLGVPRRRVQEPLAVALRVQLVALGLVAADDDLDDAGKDQA
jgi:hypothetical protein